MQNINRRVHRVAPSAVLLEPHVVDVHIVLFGPQDIDHLSIELAVDGNDLTNVVFKKVLTNSASGPKPAPK